MMASRLALSVLVLAAPNSALGQSAPYKLVVMLGSSLAITDYPTLARCERGRSAILAELERRNQEFLRSAPPGTTITPLPGSRSVFCIPG